jgi:hypothetical protein
MGVRRLCRGLLLASLGLSLGATALAANPYEGTWDLAFDGAKAAEVEGTVVVNGDGGSWHVDALSKKNPCIGRTVPIAVKTATETDFVFEVLRSKELSACKNWTVKLKRVDAKTLKGEFADGREITLERR